MGQFVRTLGALVVVLAIPLLSHAQTIPVLPPPGPLITPLTITSSNASSTLAKSGDTLTLSFTLSDIPLITPDITMEGHDIVPTSSNGLDWAATLILTPSDTEGTVSFSVTAGNVSGTATTTSTQTTDDSFVVFDATPPVVSLTGDSSLTLTVGDAFVDPGATASDTHDGTDTVQVTGSVDTSTPGVYTLSYDARDAAGNAGNEVTRTVTVEAAPVVSSGGGGGGGGGNGPIAGSLTQPVAPLAITPEPPAPQNPPAPVNPSSTPPQPQPVVPAQTDAQAPVQEVATVASSAPNNQLSPKSQPIVAVAQQVATSDLAQTAAVDATDFTIFSYWLPILFFLIFLGLVGWWISDSYKAQRLYEFKGTK